SGACGAPPALSLGGFGGLAPHRRSARLRPSYAQAALRAGSPSPRGAAFGQDIVRAGRSVVTWSGSLPLARSRSGTRRVRFRTIAAPPMARQAEANQVAHQPQT